MVCVATSVETDWLEAAPLSPVIVKLPSIVMVLLVLSTPTAALMVIKPSPQTLVFDSAAVVGVALVFRVS